MCNCSHGTETAASLQVSTIRVGFLRASSIHSISRACGHIFCDDCSKNKIALGHLGYSRPERVCVECYSKLNAAQKTSDTDVRSMYSEAAL